jgi:hypothetical protein
MVEVSRCIDAGMFKVTALMIDHLILYATGIACNLVRAEAVAIGF